MTTELRYLAWSIVLGLVHAIATGQFTTAQKGLRYALSARDEQQKLEGVGARVERAFANYMQTFPFFAAGVLAALAAGRHSGLTAGGAALYFWCRLVYVPLYATAIPVLRTLAFVGAVVGIAMLLWALT